MGYAREAPSLVFNLYCRSYSGCPVWVNVNIERVVILRSILFEILQDLSLKITLLFQFLLVFCFRGASFMRIPPARWAYHS